MKKFNNKTNTMTTVLIVIAIALLVILMTIKYAIDGVKSIQFNKKSIIMENNSDTSLEVEGVYYTNEDIEKKLTDNDYYDTVDIAMKNAKLHYLKGDEYQQNIDEIVKYLENENYIAVFFRSVESERVECFTLAIFKKKEIKETTKYAFIRCESTETFKNEIIIQGEYKDNIEGRLRYIDLIQDYNIDRENTRFMYGKIRSNTVYSLEIEGQRPTEIIEYEVFGKKRYFWYYEDLQSNKPGSELEVKLDE